MCVQNVLRSKSSTCPLKRSVCFTNNHGRVRLRRRVEKWLWADVKDRRRLENLFPTPCPFVLFSFLPSSALSLLVPLSPSMAPSLHRDPGLGNESLWLLLSVRIRGPCGLSSAQWTLVVHGPHPQVPAQFLASSRSEPSSYSCCWMGADNSRGWVEDAANWTGGGWRKGVLTSCCCALWNKRHTTGPWERWGGEQR